MTIADLMRESAAAQGASPGRYRWRICALLLAATTINYIDRQVLGVLAPELQRAFAWSEIEYGYIVTAFQAAYAIGLVTAGAIIDRLGTRIGYALAIARVESRGDESCARRQRRGIRSGAIRARAR